jgi:hypothetical protein
MDHSGNVQGIFSEHLVNIQGGDKAAAKAEANAAELAVTTSVRASCTPLS